MYKNSQHYNNLKRLPPHLKPLAYISMAGHRAFIGLFLLIPLNVVLILIIVTVALISKPLRTDNLRCLILDLLSQPLLAPQHFHPLTFLNDYLLRSVVFIWTRESGINREDWELPFYLLWEVGRGVRGRGSLRGGTDRRAAQYAQKLLIYNGLRLVGVYFTYSFF